MDLLIVFSVVIISIISIYFYIKWKFSFWERRGIPSLPVAFPYGNFKGVGKTKHIKDVLHEIYATFKGKAPIAGAYLAFSSNFAVILDLDLIKNILIKDFNNFHDRRHFYNERDDFMSANLLTMQGQEWRELRQVLTPTFTSAKMKFMFSTITEISERLIKKLDGDLDQNPIVDIKDYLARFTTDIIGTCAFGIECNSLKDANCEFRVYSKRAFLQPRHSRFFIYLCAEFPEIARALHIKLFRDDITEFFTRLIEGTITYREKNDIHRNDFIDLLLRLKTNNPNKEDGKLTVKQIIAQSLLFFLAGFETSSSTSGFALYELAFNPDIQEKAQTEINRIFKAHNNQITYEGLMEMQYLDQIINETLRKYSIVPRLVRYTQENYPLPNSNFVIEKGTKVYIPTYSIHNDPDIYPNPDIFDPSRFDPEEVNKRHPMAFLGFGTGPRNCIGARFGQMQTRMGLATLIRNFEIKPCSKTPKPLRYHPNMELVSSANDIYLELRRIL